MSSEGDSNFKRRQLVIGASVLLVVAGVLTVLATYVFFDGQETTLFIGLALIGGAFALSVVIPPKGRAASPLAGDEPKTPHESGGGAWWFIAHQERINTIALIGCGVFIALALAIPFLRPTLSFFLVVPILLIVTRIARRRLFDRSKGPLVARQDISRTERIVWLVVLVAAALGFIGYYGVAAFWPKHPDAPVGNETLRPFVLKRSDLPSGWDAETHENLDRVEQEIATYNRCFGLPKPVIAASPLWTSDDSEPVYARSRIEVLPSVADVQHLLGEPTESEARCYRMAQERLNKGFHALRRSTLSIPGFQAHRSVFSFQGQSATEDTLTFDVGHAIGYLEIYRYGKTPPPKMLEVAIATKLRDRALRRSGAF
jgi:hypothetical protein